MATNIHTLDVKILEIRSPWDFLAVECTDNSAEAIGFTQMMESMNAALNSLMEQGTMAQRPDEGEICAFLRREDNRWHRVQVDSWLEKSKGQYAWCYLIDKGFHEKAPVQRLMKLSSKYTTVPPQVLHCSLWGIQPLSLKVEESYSGLKVENRPCGKWDSSASEFMRRTFDTCRKYQIDVIEQDSDKLYVRLLMNTKHRTVCFNDVLVKENYALQTEREDKSFVQPHHDGSISGLENVSYEDTVSDFKDMPSLIMESHNKSQHFGNNTHNHKLTEDGKSITHQQDECPSLITNDDLKRAKSFVENILSDAESLDGSEIFQDNDIRPRLINELEPPVAEFFKKCISSPEKFPPLSHSPLSVKSDTLVHEGNSCEVLACMENQMNTVSPIKSPLVSSSSSSSSSETGSTPSMFTQHSSPQALSFQKFLQGRGRVLFAPQPDKRPGFPKGPVCLSPPNLQTQITPQIDPSKEEPILNGYHSDHSGSFECDFKAKSVPSMVLYSMTLNNSSPTVQPSVQEEEPENLSVADTKQLSSDGGNSITSPSSGTRTRFRKSGDAFMEKRLSEVNKQMKPMSAKIQTLLKTAAPDLRDNAVRVARGQAQGRRFLRELQLNSGHTERYPAVTRPDQPVPRPMFGVLVHGKSPLPITCFVADVPFEETVKEVLENTLEVRNAHSIQGFVWPAALASRHIIGVCPPEKGKSTAYIPAVVSLLTDKTMYIDLPRGKGPLALIVVPTSRKARDIFEVIKLFTDHKNIMQKRIRPLVLYAGGTEETESTSLITGCEILISTPASVLRMLEQEMTSFQRLCHMVLDDADILAKRFADQVDQIMQHFRLVLKNRRQQVVPCQIMMFASRWSDKLDEFRLRYTWEPIVVISSRVEASVYGGIKQVVTMSRWENRLSTFCSLLDTMVPTDKRVAAFTSDIEEAAEMWKGAKSRGVYCLLIHHDLPEETVTEARMQWLHSSHTKQLIVMVCTDQCYQDLAITNATDVIHYGLPDSKTKFGNRLACMFDYFKDRTSNIENQPKTEIEGVSHVILTDKCAPRAEQLNEILQRCPSEQPPQLKEFLRGYREGVENDERKTLCPLLKAFGTCIAHNNQENCKNRHVVIPNCDFKTGEIDQNSLPASGQVTIKVIRVVTAGNFYCHLVGHRGVDSPVSQDLRLNFFKLAMDMTAFFSKTFNQVPYLPSEDPFHDGLCAFKDEEGAFSRAKVIEVQEGTKSAPMKQCKVWLVDMGCYKYGTIDQLLCLPRRLAEVPYQAVEVYLCCVKPMDDDREWTDKVNIYVHELIEGKELVGRIMLSAGLTLWLMPLVHQVSSKEVGVTSDISLRYELLQNKFAVKNPDHMKMLYELYRGKTEIPETLMSQYFEYCLEIELTQEMLPTDQEDFMKVEIAAITNPSLLYLHKEGAIDKLEKLELDIENAVKEFDDAADRGEKVDSGMTLELGSVCLALSSDARWYRAKLVSDCVDGQWEVFFLDYGDCEHLPQSKLRGLPRSLGELPCQAIECELAYVAPIGEEWSHDTVDILCDLSYFADREKKLLYAKVVDSKESTYSMGMKLVVDIYETRREEIRFSHELVKRHMAAPISIKDRSDPSLKPVLEKPALKNQKFFNPLDKVKFLSANLHWTEDPAEAVQQARDLEQLLSFRMRGWDAALLQREVIPSVVSVIGYIPNVKAHGVVLHCLTKCCVDSLRLCDVVLENGLLERLSCCLEQKSQPDLLTQAAEAVICLVSSDRFKEECLETDALSLTLGQVLNSHTPETPLDFEVLKNLCSTASRLIHAAKESLPYVCSMDTVLQALVEATEDCDREPWLELLAAMATKQCTHTHLIRQANINIILGLLDTCSCAKCVYYCLMVCLPLVEESRKHKKVLLENKLLITLNRLLDNGLSSPAREVCEKLKSAMTLQMPEPEVLSGIPAQNYNSVDKLRSPEVLWSQNCFRVVLKVKVRNAQPHNFHIGPKRITCRVQSENTLYELDWELYDTILPDLSKIDVQPATTVISLKKLNKGQWKRLCKEKQKVFSLKPDMDNLYNSDSDEEVEDDENLTKLTERKKVIWRDGTRHVNMVPRFESSDESSDDPALYSDSDHDEPRINTELFFRQ